MDLRFGDACTIILYLAGVMGMGVYFSRKNKTTEDYFVGNRSFSGWVIGLSMLGTSISSVTFLAFPAATYSKDWRLVIPNLFLPLVILMAVWVFIPFFRRKNLISAFEYLEDRFGPLVRLYGALSFIFLQVIRLGTILFLISLLIKSFVDIDIVWVITLTGIFIAIYTIVGGIEAVIWTDVIQSIVLLLGGIITLFYITWQLPEGLGQIIELGKSQDKFLPQTGFWEWNLNERTFWTMAILGIFLWLTEYSSNQNVVQRYAAAKSTKEAQKASLICAAMSVPTWLFFCLVGTGLFVFYQAFPDPQVAQLSPEEIYPFFILQQLPVGVCGIVIAGVLAAAMSSLDSSINAISAVTVVDILKRYLYKDQEDKQYLRAAKITATVSSILMIITAIIFSTISAEEKESMQNLQLIMASIFGGCLLGLFMLGFFAPRVTYQASLIALVFATLFNVYLLLNKWEMLPDAISLPGFHWFWVGTVVNVFFAVAAYGLSWILPKEEKDLQELTVWT